MSINLRKLPMDEVERFFPRRGQMDLSEYREALQDLHVGEAAEVDLGGLTQRAAKRRIGQAANSLGMRIKWSRQVSNDSVAFMVMDRGGTAPATGRRRGRRPAGAV